MAVFLCRCSAWWFKSLFLVWQQYKTVCIHLLTVRENGNLHDLIPVVSTVMLKRFRRELKIWLYSILVSICWSNSVFILHLFSYLGQRCFGKFAEVWKLLLQEVWSFLKKKHLFCHWLPASSTFWKDSSVWKQTCSVSYSQTTEYMTMFRSKYPCWPMTDSLPLACCVPLS